MRSITKILLVLNGIALLFILLWLLVGGGNRGYFGGGAAGEVDGILLMFLALFNLGFLFTIFLFVLGASPGQADAAVGGMVSQERFRSALRTWSLWGLAINGVVILFVGLWLLINSGRWTYFQANATEVDMILLLLLSMLNISYMGLACLRFTASPEPHTQSSPEK
jgi:hypothetical protein